MRAIPDAERLWRSRFTSTGKIPTHASMIPITTSAPVTTLIAGRASEPPTRRRSRPTYSVKVVTSRPPAISVPLNSRLERSPNVPS